jgi:hypothetical protein
VGFVMNKVALGHVYLGIIPQPYVIRYRCLVGALEQRQPTSILSYTNHRPTYIRVVFRGILRKLENCISITYVHKRLFAEYIFLNTLRISYRHILSRETICQVALSNFALRRSLCHTPPTDYPDSLRFRSVQFGATYAGLELKQEAATQRVRSLRVAATTAFRVMSTAMEALIAEVYKRPVLWDHRNKEYHNRQCVDTAWTSVAHKLGVGSKYDGWTAHVSEICA